MVSVAGYPMQFYNFNALARMLESLRKQGFRRRTDILELQKLFKENGYIAISHNSLTSHTDSADVTDEPVLGPRAAGVILVVSSCHITGWSNVVLDIGGRAIAASLDAQDGSTIRIIGTYGVSGSNCTNFTSFPAKVKAESVLNQFISKQVSYCSQNGIRVVVVGDLNS